MRHYFLLCLLLCLAFNGWSQKINRQYSFYPQESGNVYFIHPQKGFKSDQDGAVKDLRYDITYLSGQDSVSYTFTYFFRDVLQVDSVTISDRSGKPVFTGQAEMLYVQPKKSFWQHRASVKIPYHLLEKLYQEEMPYELLLHGNNKNARYTLKPKKWQKQAGIISRIFEVVKYNL